LLHLALVAPETCEARGDKPLSKFYRNDSGCLKSLGPGHSEHLRLACIRLT
jgi:hypothetical protein